MKRICICFLFMLAALGVHAAAPELKNMLPLNSSKLTRLSRAQEEALAADCSGMISDAKKNFSMGSDFGFYSAYRQNVGDRIFYRIFVTSCEIDRLRQWKVQEGQYSESEYYWLSSPLNSVLQVVVEQKGRSLAYIASDVFGLWQNLGSEGTCVYYSDYILFEAAGDVAIMHGSFSLPVATGMMRDGLIKISPRTRGARFYARQSAQYTLIDANGSSSVFSHDSFLVTVQASDFLVDPDTPLRYSLLSAFDGDAHTCYRENAEENFITLEFSFKCGAEWTRRNGRLRIKEASIINGDASSRNAYFGADRISAVTAEARESTEAASKETYTFTLNDYQFAPQGIFLPFSEGKYSYVIHTTGIYRADEDDVCMSEFNLKTQNSGWLFGSR